MHKYSNEPLPKSSYLELLGKALYVFNNSNSCVIETILHYNSDDYSWNDLIDRNSGNLRYPTKQTIAAANSTIADEFEELVDMRNRIAHSFQIDGPDGLPILAARDRNGRQYTLDTEYLSNFIDKSQKFVQTLEEFKNR